MDGKKRTGASLGAYIVGAYLFSVPAFAYSDSTGLLIIPQLTGALLVVYALLDVVKSRTIKIPSEILLYGLFCLWAVTTFVFGASTSETLSLGTLVKVATATLACAQLIKDDADLFAALKIFVFSILFIYLQNRGDLELLRVADRITDSDRFAGTLTNANTAAIFSMSVVWASVLLLLNSKKALLSRAAYLVPLGTALLIIYYSGSKKGFIGIGLFVLFFARLLFIRQGTSVTARGLTVVASAALIIVTGYFIYASPFFFRMQEALYGNDASTVSRLTLAGEAARVWLTNFKTFLMGVGYDNFRLFSDFQTYAHSTPLELLASTGLVGCSLFVGFLFVLFRKLLFLTRHELTQKSKSIIFSCLIFVFIFSVFMLAAVMHDSRELLPILGALAAFGQYRFRLLGQGLVKGAPAPSGGDSSAPGLQS